MNYLQKIFAVLAVLTLTYFAKGIKAGEPRQKVSKIQNMCKAHPNGAILANPNDCHKFYICIKKIPYEYNCEPAYHYDSATRSCRPGPSCNSISDETPTCTNGKIRSLQDDCNAFEACINGQYQKLYCPSSYYFDALKGICVPFKYDAHFKCNCLMPEYTIMKNEDNCETYFVCRRKSAVLEYCPLGKYYDNILNTCITDLEGMCLMKPTIAPENLHQGKENMDQP